MVMLFFFNDLNNRMFKISKSGIYYKNKQLFELPFFFKKIIYLNIQFKTQNCT